jgi:hypothetical protein
MKLLRKMVVRGNCYRGQYSEQYETATEPDYGRIYTNQRIYEITSTRALSEYIGKQQAKFAAHTIRESNNRETKQLMYNSDTKPGNSLEDLLGQALKYMGHVRTEQDVFQKFSRNRGI